MRSRLPHSRSAAFGLLALSAFSAALPHKACAAPAASEQRVRLATPGSGAVAQARQLGRLRPTAPLALALTLPLRHQDQLTDLLRGLYDPTDARFHHFLTPQQFADRFSPTQQDYDAVVSYARRQGLTVTETHPNRLLVGVRASAAQAEAAFAVRLHSYRFRDGRTFVAPDAAPSVPAALAGRVHGIFGLSTGVRPHPMLTRLPTQMLKRPRVASADTPLPAPGTGHYGYYSPHDFLTAYNIQPIRETGKGQSVALFELGGFNRYDIAVYNSYYRLRNVPLEVVPVGGYNGADTPGTDDEIESDIEMVTATAPGLDKILVYESDPGDPAVPGYFGGGVEAGWLSQLSRIASDNRARQVSMSYGASEDEWLTFAGAEFLETEGYFFQQMAAQGQSVYTAAGDNGAYESLRRGFQAPTVRTAIDPGAQPYVCAVGGTELFLNPDQTYKSETTWDEFEFIYGGTSYNLGGGGGGISKFEPTPPWQAPFINADNQGSTTYRNVPDVSLNAAVIIGYDVYITALGGWTDVGGTSLASPIWAAFNARVNQARQGAGLAPLGLVTPTLYGVAGGPAYSAEFHDIADGSTNGDTTLFGVPGFPAVPGYDLATGLGSMNGAALFADLAGEPSVEAPPTNPSGVQVVAEDGLVSLSWNKTPGAVAYFVYRGAQNADGSFALGYLGRTRVPSYQDRSVKNGTPYVYALGAVGGGGQSDYADGPVYPATPLALALTAPPVAVPAATSARVLWLTSIPSDSTVQYGTGGTLEYSVHLPQGVTAHSVKLSGLAPRSVYTCRVLSADASHTVASGKFHFKTPAR